MVKIFMRRVARTLGVGRDARDIGCDEPVVIGPRRGREEQLIASALMRTFEMIMLDELSDGSAQRGFTKEVHFDRLSG